MWFTPLFLQLCWKTGDVITCERVDKGAHGGPVEPDGVQRPQVFHVVFEAGIYQDESGLLSSLQGMSARQATGMLPAHSPARGVGP